MDPTKNEPSKTPGQAIPDPIVSPPKELSPIGYTENTSGDYASVAVSTVPDPSEATAISTANIPPAEAPPVEPQSLIDKEPPKNRKKIYILLAIILTLVVSLIGVGGYALYYNNPDKVLLDTLDNSLKTKIFAADTYLVAKAPNNQGGITVEFSSQSDNPRLASTFDAKVKIDYAGVKLNLSGAGMSTEEGNMYFKLNNATELFDETLKSEYGQLYASQPSMAPVISQLRAFMQKIDGQWVKITPDDIGQYDEDYAKDRECYKKAINNFYNDSKQKQQIVDTYLGNQFIAIYDTKESDNINGKDVRAYHIKANLRTLNKFSKKIEKTEIMKSLGKCTGTEDLTSEPITDEEYLSEQQKDLDKYVITLWVTSWGHELQKIEVVRSEKGSGSVRLESTIKSGVQPDIKDPSKYLDLKDLSKELEAIYKQSVTSSTDQMPDDTPPLRDQQSEVDDAVYL